MGADPVRPPLEGDAAHRAFAVNNLDQYRAFREGLPDGEQELIMGGGLVGTEFANDLSATGYQPVVVDMLGHPLVQLVPSGSREDIRAALEEKGAVTQVGTGTLRDDEMSNR